uniref:Uncharacterized protein n=1 Tax=Steinernema glaseri TaxID=37863 RepID=A0A1I7ZW86_9BILA
MDMADEGAPDSRLELPHLLGYFHSHSYWIRLQGVTEQEELGEMSLAIRFTFQNGHRNGEDNGRRLKPVKEPPL